MSESISWAARTKYVPLSEYISDGKPRRDVNRFSAAKNVFAVISPTSSKCIALVARHTHKHIYPLRSLGDLDNAVNV